MTDKPKLPEEVDDLLGKLGNFIRFMKRDHQGRRVPIADEAKKALVRLREEFETLAIEADVQKFLNQEKHIADLQVELSRVGETSKIRIADLEGELKEAIVERNRIVSAAVNRNIDMEADRDRLREKVEDGHTDRCECHYGHMPQPTQGCQQLGGVYHSHPYTDPRCEEWRKDD